MDSAREADLVNAVVPRRLYLLLGVLQLKYRNVNCTFPTAKMADRVSLLAAASCGVAQAWLL
jgi:hypothetical protein